MKRERKRQRSMFQVARVSLAASQPEIARPQPGRPSPGLLRDGGAVPCPLPLHEPHATSRYSRCTMLQTDTRRGRRCSATGCTVSAAWKAILEQRFIAPKDKLTSACTLAKNCRKGIHCEARTRHADHGHPGTYVLARLRQAALASWFGSIPVSGAVLGDSRLEPESSEDPFWQRQQAYGTAVHCVQTVTPRKR
jgi:hypothetical protein